MGRALVWTTLGCLAEEVLGICQFDSCSDRSLVAAIDSTLRVRCAVNDGE
jgi:hypothetical protein